MHARDDLSATAEIRNGEGRFCAAIDGASLRAVSPAIRGPRPAFRSLGRFQGHETFSFGPQTEMELKASPAGPGLGSGGAGVSPGPRPHGHAAALPLRAKVSSAGGQGAPAPCGEAAGQTRGPGGQPRAHRRRRSTWAPEASGGRENNSSHAGPVTEAMSRVTFAGTGSRAWGQTDLPRPPADLRAGIPSFTPERACCCGKRADSLRGRAPRCLLKRPGAPVLR